MEALNALAPRMRQGGVLLGHKRGHRFIVENLLPTPGGLDPRPAFLARLDELFGGRAIGLFGSGGAARLKTALRQPAAAGRMLLCVRFGKSGPRFEAWAVDFDGRFRFVPLPLILEDDRP